MSDTEHARFSPSKMERILSCPGSLALEETCPDRVSKYAAEGTAAHTLGQWALTDGKFYTRAYQGRIIEVIEKQGTPQETRLEFEADEDMCEYVQMYVDDIQKRIEAFELQGAKVTLLVEQRIDISRVLGVPGQFGTADCVLLVEFNTGKTLLVVIDLKYGMGVEVVAEGNKQLKTYGAGTLDTYEIVHDIDRVLLVINMPRLGYVSEWELSADELRAFGDELKQGATLALANIEIFKETRDARTLTLSPGEKQCRFCRAKGMCPQLATEALGRVVAPVATVDDFDDLTALGGEVKKCVAQSTAKIDEGVVTKEQLAEFMDAADMVEDWLKGVRARVEVELYESGNAPGIIPGWMLGEGRRGHRAWKSVVAVEDTMKSMRLKTEDMYTRKIISPAQAEKFFKGNARRWNKLKEMIFQPEGNPSVVRDSDAKRKRLVVKPAVDSFDDLDAAGEYADLV